MTLCKTLFISALLGCLATLSATTQYTYTFSTSTSSLSIPEATHGINSANYGVALYDGSGLRVATSAYSYSIDQSTYALSITFSPARSTGKLVLAGAYAPTSGANDFAGSVSTSTGGLAVDTLTINASGSAVNRQFASGKRYAMSDPYKVLVNNWSTYTYATLRVYFLDSELVFAVDVESPFFGAVVTAGSNTSCASCSVVYGIGWFPTGSSPIAQVLFDGNNGGFQAVSDQRSFQ